MKLRSTVLATIACFLMPFNLAAARATEFLETLEFFPASVRTDTDLSFRAEWRALFFRLTDWKAEKDHDSICFDNHLLDKGKIEKILLKEWEIGIIRLGLGHTAPERRLSFANVVRKNERTGAVANAISAAFVFGHLPFDVPIHIHPQSGDTAFCSLSATNVESDGSFLLPSASGSMGQASAGGGNNHADAYKMVIGGNNHADTSKMVIGGNTGLDNDGTLTNKGRIKIEVAGAQLGDPPDPALPDPTFTPVPEINPKSGVSALAALASLLMLLSERRRFSRARPFRNRRPLPTFS